MHQVYTSNSWLRDYNVVDACMRTWLNKCLYSLMSPSSLPLKKSVFLINYSRFISLHYANRQLYVFSLDQSNSSGQENVYFSIFITVMFGLPFTPFRQHVQFIIIKAVMNASLTDSMLLHLSCCRLSNLPKSNVMQIFIANFTFITQLLPLLPL